MLSIIGFFFLFFGTTIFIKTNETASAAHLLCFSFTTSKWGAVIILWISLMDLASYEQLLFIYVLRIDFMLMNIYVHLFYLLIEEFFFPFPLNLIMLRVKVFAI